MLTDQEVMDIVKSVERKCRGPLVNPVERGGSRMHCGYDFNLVVLSFPFDGEEREYECPKCGITGTFRSPHKGD